MRKSNSQIKNEIIDGFIKLLNGFDWYYEYSDDHKIWKRGKRQEKEIYDYMKANPAATEVLDAIHTFMNPETAINVQAADSN